MRGEKEMVILVRGVRPDTVTNTYHDPQNFELYRRHEFYRVDLMSDVPDGHVLEPFLDSLMSADVSCVVFSESVGYAISHGFSKNERVPDCISFVTTKVQEGTDELDEVKLFKVMDSTTPNPPGGEMVACLKSVSCVNFKGPNPTKWKTLPSPLTFSSGCQGGFLNGKLYCLLSAYLNEAQYFDPRCDKWFLARAQPPDSFELFFVHRKMIPDPDNNRFFAYVALDGAPDGAPANTVYAWHPDSSGSDHSPWYPVQPSLPFRVWKHPILVDKLFFLYCRKLPAVFHIWSYEDDRWLQVEWSTPHPIFVKASSVCYLGNQQLCVCASSRIEEPFYGARLDFYIFAFERTSDSCITFKHCFTRSFLAKDIIKAEEVVVLPDLVEPPTS